MNLNEVLNEFNFNNLNNAPEDDGALLIGGLFMLFLLALVVFIVFFISKKRAGSSEDEDGTEGDGGSPADGDGARSPAVIQALTTLPPDTGDTDLDKFLKVLGPLLLGLGTSVALEIVQSAIKRLAASSKTLIKNQIKALRAFKTAARPKFSARAVARSARKLLLTKLSTLSIVARVRLGMVWSKALKAAGWSTERITQTLSKRLGEEAAQRVAQSAAQRAAVAAASSASMGPLAVAELAFSAVSLGLDLSNTGGWLDIDQRQTSDLLKEKAIIENEIKTSYIQGFKNDDGVVDPSTAVGFYPLYWGPLDEMGDTVNSDGLDVFDVMVETKMFEMLFADEPDPFIVKLLTNVAKRYGSSSTNIEELFSASMLTDMSENDYYDLYDRAFDSICIDNGGVLIDTGVSGRPKQCSHASETACHAKSPWIEGTGLNASDDKDTTYTEWRERDFFNKNYGPAQVPAGAAGACIIQDPSYHEMCSSEKICRTGAGAETCYKNSYVRNRGICQNTEDLCRGFGVTYCADMRQRGGSGGDCPTGMTVDTQADLGQYANILLPNETLPSCYKKTNDKWAEFFLGSVIYRYFKSGQFVSDTVANLEVLGQALADTGKAILVQTAGDESGVLAMALNSGGGTTDEYSGPGTIPDVECSYYSGTRVIKNCGQTCGDKVMINVGAGNYCYDWCEPGKNRGSDITSVDTCKSQGACDRAKACPYTPRSYSGRTPPQGVYNYGEGFDQDNQTIKSGGSLTRRGCELFCDGIAECNGIVTYAPSSGGSGECFAVYGLPNLYSRQGSAVASRSSPRCEDTEVKIKCNDGSDNNPVIGTYTVPVTLSGLSCTTSGKICARGNSALAECDIGMTMGKRYINTGGACSRPAV